MPINRSRIQLLAGVAALLALSAIVGGGCAQQAAVPPAPPVQAVQVKPGPPEKVLSPEEAMAVRNKMLKRQSDYWRAHGQGH